MTDRPEEISREISRLRRPHDDVGLDVADLDPNPIAQFSAWMSDALGSEKGLPNAMTLATSTSEGVVSARVVLLKGFDDDGFVFFTNYLSRKAREIEENPRAALVMHWYNLERQVGVKGPVEKVSRRESEDYFATRPLGSRIGAWASPQSSVIGGRDELDRNVEELHRRYPQGDIPCPPHWGGYRVVPEEIEFWQARLDRLHDRFRYLRNGGGWRIERLAP